MNNLRKKNYNPDVLDALVNLSSDEVFTPPKIANQILDLLPQELFRNKETTFLDPASKSGVFLREIAKRLIKGLEKEIPDLQERLNHIYTKQLFGIAITDLTGLLSRRSLYGTKTANGKYSFCTEFDNEKGSIRFERLEHSWQDGKCEHCGASESEYKRGEDLETHAYEFIHKTPEEIINLFNTKNMKFDVIIGNPPYQLNTGSTSAQAIPLYHKFVQQAKKLNPRFLIMIIPGRWYAGGMGLGEFRSEMLNDKRIRKLVDYPNARDCFPGIELRGGVCYFLWDRDNPGICEYTNIVGDQRNTVNRNLSEYPIFVRWNQALQIIEKVKNKKEESLSKIVSSVSPFGLVTSVKLKQKKEKNKKALLTVYSSKGTGYISKDAIIKNRELVGKYKVLLSQLISGNLETPPFKVISLLKVLNLNEVCTHTYLTVGNFDQEVQAKNLKSYLSTKFVRFLLLQGISNMHISKEKFMFVPIQAFTSNSDINWNKTIPEIDKQLYKKYGLTKKEIDFIESMVRPMG